MAVVPEVRTCVRDAVLEDDLRRLADPEVERAMMGSADFEQVTDLLREICAYICLTSMIPPEIIAASRESDEIAERCAASVSRSIAAGVLGGCRTRGMHVSDVGERIIDRAAAVEARRLLAEAISVGTDSSARPSSSSLARPSQALSLGLGPLALRGWVQDGPESTSKFRVPDASCQNHFQRPPKK